MGIGGAAALSALLDHAKQSGMYEVARATEFKSAPPKGLCFALWVQGLGPAPVGSGLATTAALLHATARIYLPMLTRPEADVELRVLAACDDYLGRLAANFTLGDTARNIDLLGEQGEPMRWTYGYLTIDSTMYRIADLEIYVVFSDAWDQHA